MIVRKTFQEHLVQDLRNARLSLHAALQRFDMEDRPRTPEMRELFATVAQAFLKTKRALKEAS